MCWALLFIFFFILVYFYTWLLVPYFLFLLSYFFIFFFFPASSSSSSTYARTSKVPAKVFFCDRARKSRRLEEAKGLMMQWHVFIGRCWEGNKTTRQAKRKQHTFCNILNIWLHVAAPSTLCPFGKSRAQTATGLASSPGVWHQSMAYLIHIHTCEEIVGPCSEMRGSENEIKRNKTK